MLEHLTYKEIWEAYIREYYDEFGQKKLNEIDEKIRNSNKVAGLIARSKYNNSPINGMDVLNCVNSMTYFIFAKPRTNALACLLAFQRWNDEVNTYPGFWAQDD